MCSVNIKRIHKTHSCKIKLFDLSKDNHLNLCSYSEGCCRSRW